MLDVAVSYNKYRFLGCEFLTWLWFVMEDDQESLQKLDPELASLDVGNRIVLENRHSDTKESITIKGDDAGLEEGMLALKKGAVVTEMNLCYRAGEHEWRFSLKGESFNISNLKAPDTGPVESSEDIEGALLEKVYLNEKVVHLIDTVYGRFIRLRISEAWNADVVPNLKTWIKS